MKEGKDQTAKKGTMMYQMTMGRRSPVGSPWSNRNEQSKEEERGVEELASPTETYYSNMRQRGKKGHQGAYPQSEPKGKGTWKEQQALKGEHKKPLVAPYHKIGGKQYTAPQETYRRGTPLIQKA